MPPKIQSETLLIIPCCAKKVPNGAGAATYSDPLGDSVSSEIYEQVLQTRREVLRAVQSKPEFISGKYLKNGEIVDGAEFGGASDSGKYLPALERYAGTLYSVDGLRPRVESTVGQHEQPRVMILSALYGPLDPRSRIQDYNLKMDDAPARAWSTAFPIFLQDYVTRNGISEISLYLGTTTKYFSVAGKAVAALKAKGVIRRAVQYHVVKGGTRPTPLAHGRRLLGDLGGARDPRVYDPNEIQESVL